MIASPCSLCKAFYPEGETCQLRFERCLALEFEHPDTYGAVHHLTVAGYYLQHNLYSQKGWLQSRKLLEQFVQQGLHPQQGRREYKLALDSQNRSWSVIHGEKLAEFDQIVWTRTLADVRLNDPDVYCRDIHTWAVSILADTRFIKTGTINP